MPIVLDSNIPVDRVLVTGGRAYMHQLNWNAISITNPHDRLDALLVWVKEELDRRIT